MNKKALIVRGGWDGHQPVQVAEVFHEILVDENFEVEVSDTLDSFLDKEKLMNLSLIIPIWTMGKLPRSRSIQCLKQLEMALVLQAVMVACVTLLESVWIGNS